MKNIRRAILGLSLFVAVAAFAAPSITTLTPNTGAVGSSIVIAGSGFGNNQSKATVKFNGTQATITSFSSTSITATVPSGATTGNVVVTISSVASNGVTFTVTGAPSISSLTPNIGAVGSSVVIAGSNFGPSQGNGMVTFTSGLTATVTSWSASSITATAPTNAATGNVVVTAAGGVASNGVSFTVTAAPSISSLTPNTGVVGSSVVIAGSNFGATQGNGGVTFNGTTATIGSWSSTSITATVPTGATTGNVLVTAAGQVASNGVTFTIPPPSIANISPDLARVGASITIAGNNFGPAPGSLTFNGTAAVPTSWNNTQIVTPVPNGATTGPVVVTQAGTSNSVSFTVDPPPSITSISPTSGPANSSVTVTGSGFGIPQGTSTIQFNGTVATPFSWSDGSIIVPVPIGATTGPVVLGSGGLNSNGVAFTVTPAPNISGLSISSGAPGTAVTINGQNFGSTQGDSVVRFNGLPASVTTWGANAIAVPVPSGSTTGPVTVTVSGQTSNGVTFTAITTGTLSGTVSSSSGGTAISGASVQALQNGNVKGSATSAGDGSYSIPNLPAGNYDVQASASGFGTGLKNSVALTAGQTATANFSLSSPGTISGKVTQSDGVTGISSAAVRLFVGGASMTTATADAGGNYSISGLNAGSYSLQAGANNYVTQTQSATVTGGNTSTINFLLQPLAANPINYVYDELGRLVAVIDSSGDTAKYQYDAVGNIHSISRQNSDQLSIIKFTPRSGLTGASVTIFGTGFSATAAQDTVTFNGVSATVSSATATQINTTVPAAASTGAITVTTPSGSVTSSTNFTIVTSSGAPTITGFSPNMGASGTAVAITGTNFDIAPNDRATFNSSFAATTSATNSQVNTNVPSNTSSGRISVATPAGTAISTQDFYIPFGTHVVGDIGYTGRVAFGGTQNLTLATSKIGLLLFDGTAGQGVSLQLSGSTFSTCTLYLYSPTQVQLASKSCTSSTTFVASVALPSTGTYTIGIDPGTSFGSITIGLTQDVVGSISFGTPVNVSISISGQAARYSFNGTANQIVSLEVAGFGSNGFSTAILNPDGGTLANGNCCSGWETIIGKPLPSTGTYQIVITPQSGATGSLTVSLMSNTTNPTISFGTPTTTTTSITSLIAYNFSGTAGQVVSLETSGFGNGGYSTTLLNPDGSTLANGTCCSGRETIIGKSLPFTGTYQIIVVPQGGVSGSMTVSLISNTSNPTISFGTPVIATISTASLIAYNFSGTAGQVVSLETSGFGNGGYSTTLLNPDGSTSANGTCCSGRETIIGLPLPFTGTYQIIVVPQGGVSGSMTVSLISNTSNPTISFGTPVIATISTTSLIAYNFSGTAGQVVSLEANGFAGGSYSTYLLNPDGSTLASLTCCNNQQVITGKTLLSSGTYQIIVVPQGGVSGSMTVSLISNTSNPTISFGTPVIATISTTSLIAYNFTGTAGQVVSLETNGFAGGGYATYLLNSDGSTLASVTFGSNQEVVTGKSLPSTGTYQIIVAPNNGITGSLTISLTSNATNPTISFGTPVTATISNTSLIAYSFSGTAGQVLSLEASGLGGGNYSTYLLNSDGSTLASVTCCNNQEVMTGKSLPSTGTYQIIVAPNNGVTGSLTISLTSNTTNPTISFGTPVTATISNTSLIAYSFSGTAAQVVSVHVTPSFSGGFYWTYILNPDGSTLASTFTNGSATLSGQTLGSTGTYQIIIAPNSGVTGSATVSLTNP